MKLISGPTHPPKVKYSPKHQNACTTSHRKTRKLSPSSLRVISSATKTPTKLLKPLHLRTCLAAGSTLSIINLARLPLTVLKTSSNFTPIHLIGLGSLKGAYDIKVDPTVPPVQHARRKVPIKSKQAIEEAIDYMVSEGILEQQIKPTPWVSSVTYPVKPSGEVRPCLDARDLNRAIIRGKPQAPDSGGNCSPAGWSDCIHKGRCPEGLSTGTPDRRELQAAHDQHTQGKVQIQEDALWSQNVTGHVPDENGTSSWRSAQV